MLKTCQLPVKKLNPRQYAAEIPSVPGMEVWFQRATDVVRKIVSGDIDIAFAGSTILAEIEMERRYRHRARLLGFGGCHLSVAIPQAWGEINSMRELMALPKWGPSATVRCHCQYPSVWEQFFKDIGFDHVEISTADGALEAAPAMGAADCILDLVSSGTTLRKNNLKEIEGGRVLDSQGVLVASRLC